MGDVAPVQGAKRVQERGGKFRHIYVSKRKHAQMKDRKESCARFTSIRHKNIEIFRTYVVVRCRGTTFRKALPRRIKAGPWNAVAEAKRRMPVTGISAGKLRGSTRGHLKSSTLIFVYDCAIRDNS